MRTRLPEIHQTATTAGLKPRKATADPSRACQADHGTISAQPNDLIRRSLRVPLFYIFHD
jgi:hypothetical protein